MNGLWLSLISGIQMMPFLVSLDPDTPSVEDTALSSTLSHTDQIVDIYSDIRLATNFLEDAFADSLKGFDNKKLFGADIKIVIKLFCDLFKSFISKREVGDRFQKVLIYLQGALDYSNLNEFYEKKIFLNERLKGGENFLITWGFTNYNGRNHAMLVEFESTPIVQTGPNKSTSYNVIVYNTGDGIRYHRQCFDSNSAKIEPFVRFTDVNVEKLTDDDFLDAFLCTDYLRYRIKPQSYIEVVRNQMEVGAKDLYVTVFQTINEHRNDPVEPIWQKAQIGGTCTVSVVWAFILKKLVKVDVSSRSTSNLDYSIYKLTKESLHIEYLSKLLPSVNTITDHYQLHLWQLLLEHSLANLARHEVKYVGFEKPGVFSEIDSERSSIIEKGNKVIEKIKSLLKDRFEDGNRICPITSYKQYPHPYQLVQPLNTFLSPSNDGKHEVISRLSPVTNLMEEILSNYTTEDPYEYFNFVSPLLSEMADSNDHQTRITLSALVSQSIIRLTLDDLQKFLDKFPKKNIEIIEPNKYKTTFDNIVSLVKFLKSKRQITVSVVLAIVKLSYYAWRLACQWDELIFVLQMFGSVKVDPDTHPTIFIKNYLYAQLLFFIGDTIEKSDNVFLYSSGDPLLIQQIRDIKLRLSEVKAPSQTEKHFIGLFSGCFIQTRYLEHHFQHADLSSFINGYFSIAENSAVPEIKEFAQKSKEGLYKYFSTKFTEKGFYYGKNDAHEFSMTAPGFFVKCTSDPQLSIWPELAVRAKSPYANLAYLATLIRYETYDLDLSCFDDPDLDSIVKEESSPGNKKCSFHYLRRQKPLVQTPKRHFQPLTSSYEEIQFVEYFPNDNKMTLKRLEKSDIKNTSIVVRETENRDGIDMIFQWYQIWSQVDNGSLLLTNFSHCAAIQHGAFLPKIVVQFFDIFDRLRNHIIYYAYSVLNSIFERSNNFLNAVEIGTEDVMNHIQIASMSAYFISQIVMINEVEKRKSSIRAVDCIKVFLKTLQKSIKLTRGDCLALGIMHAACFNLKNCIFEREKITEEQFQSLFKHYVGFKLSFDYQFNESPNYILDQIYQAYLMRLMQFLSVPNQKSQIPKMMSAAIADIPLLNEFVEWSWDSDFPETLLRSGPNSLNFHIITGQFWGPDWLPYRKFNRFDLKFEQKIASELIPKLPYAEIRENYLVFEINSSLHIRVDSRSSNCYLDHKEYGNFKFFSSYHVNSTGNIHELGCARHLIYEPKESNAVYFTWHNLVGDYVFTDSCLRIIFIAKKDSSLENSDRRSYSLEWNFPNSNIISISAVFEPFSGGHDFIFPNFISRNIINQNHGEIYNTNPFSYIVCDSCQNKGIVVPSYRFDTNDASSILFIRESKPLNSRGESDLEPLRSPVLEVIHDGIYSIDEDQSLMIGGNFDDHTFIICSKNEKTYALVPIDNPHSFNPRNRKENGEYQDRNDEPMIDAIRKLEFIDVKVSEEIQIDGSRKRRRNLSPTSRLHVIFCAYYCLGKRLYPESLRFIKSISLTSEFTDDEMKLLEMFLTIDKVFYDVFPEAIALRVYIAWVIRVNVRNFNSCSIRKEQTKENQKLRKWMICMGDVDGGNKMGNANDDLVKNIENYFKIEGNLTPAFTVFTFKQGRQGLLSQLETIEFLMSILPDSADYLPYTATYLRSKTDLLNVELEIGNDSCDSVFPEITKDSQFDGKLLLRDGQDKSGLQPHDLQIKFSILRPEMNGFKRIFSSNYDTLRMKNLIKYGGGIDENSRHLMIRTAIEMEELDDSESLKNDIRAGHNHPIAMAKACLKEGIIDSSTGRDVANGKRDSLGKKIGSFDSIAASVSKTFQIFSWMNPFRKKSDDEIKVTGDESKVPWKDVFRYLREVYSKPVVSKTGIAYKKKFKSVSEYWLKFNSTVQSSEDENYQSLICSPQVESSLQSFLDRENQLCDQILTQALVLPDCVMKKVDIDDLNVKFKDEFYNQSYEKFLINISEDLVSRKLSETQTGLGVLLDISKVSDLVCEIITVIDECNSEAKRLLNEIMAIWGDNRDPVLNGTILPERRSMVPAPGEIFTVLAKQSKASIHSVFPGMKLNPSKTSKTTEESCSNHGSFSESLDDIEHGIYERIVKLAFYTTGEQYWQRILDKIGFEPSEDEQAVREPVATVVNVSDLYCELQSKRDEKWLHYPWIMTFEAASGMRLRKEQVDDLIRMSSKSSDPDQHQQTAEKLTDIDVNKTYPNITVQRLMAYGKTLVLGTGLGLVKADGYHLSVNIIPSSLLETNAKDMSARGANFFNQNAKLVRFYREKDLQRENENLFSIIASMKRIITERGFAVMTIETIQGLINRWFIIKRKLSQNKEYVIDQEIQEQLESNLHLLDVIFQILRERGAALFDEIDLTFDPMKDLSFPIDKKTNVNPQIKEMIIDLMHSISKDVSLRSQGLDISENKQYFFNYCEETRDYLALKLSRWLSEKLKIEHIDELRRILVSEIGDDFKTKMDCLQVIIEYQMANSPHSNAENTWWSLFFSDKKSFANVFDQKSRDLIAAAHLLINVWLRRDLKNIIGQTMGPSMHSSYQFARPYAAAKTPKENSEFSDKYQSVILTCMMYVNIGMSEEQVNNWIEKLKGFDDSNETVIDKAQIADKTFEDQDNLCRSLKLSLLELARRTYGNPDMKFMQLINMNGDEKKKLILALMKPRTHEALDVVFDYVRNVVFDNYEVYDEQVFSTALDASVVFRSVQGYSGTIPNDYCFDRRIKEIFYDKGVNEMAIMSILSIVQKNESFVIDMTDDHDDDRSAMGSDTTTEPQQPSSNQARLDHIFSRLLTNKDLEARKDKYTSLIDVGAEFKDFSNYEIANAVLEHFGTAGGGQITCVLFFDEQSNHMMFINKEMREPKLLPPTPNGRIDIDKATGTSMTQRFVIYGQRHITGVDIEQPEYGRAIVTLNKGVTMRDLLQGVFRMRKILSKQRVDFVISRQYGDIIRKEMPRILENFRAVENIKIEHLLIMAQYYAYEKQIQENKSLVYQKINARLKSHLISDGLTSSYSGMFEILGELDLFVRKSKDDFYNQVSTKECEKLLHEDLESYVGKIKKLLKDFDGDDSRQVFEDLESIIRDCPICNPELKMKNNSVGMTERITIVEVLLDTINEQERQLDMDINNSKAYERQAVNLKSVKNLDDRFVQKLRDLLVRDEMNETTVAALFSDNIYATRNFYQTIESESGDTINNIRNRFRKSPVFVLAFKKAYKVCTVLVIVADVMEITREPEFIYGRAAVFTLNAEIFPLQTSKRNYTWEAKRLLEDNSPEGVLSHISQILLLNGDFEMLDRYSRMKKILIDRIESHPQQYADFMNDKRNHHPSVKHEKLCKRKFYHLWKDIERASFDNSVPPPEKREKSEDEVLGTDVKGRELSDHGRFQIPKFD